MRFARNDCGERGFLRDEIPLGVVDHASGGVAEQLRRHGARVGQKGRHVAAGRIRRESLQRVTSGLGDLPHGRGAGHAT